jgi:hypothetical protein
MEVDQPVSVAVPVIETCKPVGTDEPASAMSTVPINSTLPNVSTASHDKEVDVSNESDQPFTPVSPTRKAKKKKTSTSTTQDSVDDTIPTVDTSKSATPSTHRPSQINHTL